MDHDRAQNQYSEQQGKHWYFNTLTQQPELGMKSPASHRMGPYASKEEAERAYEIVQERNRAWEQQDAQWGSRN